MTAKLIELDYFNKIISELRTLITNRKKWSVCLHADGKEIVVSIFYGTKIYRFRNGDFNQLIFDIRKFSESGHGFIPEWRLYHESN